MNLNFSPRDIKCKKFVRQDFKRDKVYQKVLDDAERLHDYLIKKENTLFDLRSKHGTKSQEVQNVFIEFMMNDLGFESEKKGLFKDFKLKPDYFKKIEKSGIILEVERGKTYTNNMDVYDFWKCHQCEFASHLFLIIPIELPRKSQNRWYLQKIYDPVCQRMKVFFEEGNYTNVHSLTIFGY